MSDEEMLKKVAMAIYCASSPFTLVTIYDALKMAEAAIKAIKEAEANESPSRV